MLYGQTINVRLSEDDRKRLDAIASRLAIPASTAIRMLIKIEYDRRIENEKDC